VERLSVCAYLVQTLFLYPSAAFPPQVLELKSQNFADTRRASAAYATMVSRELQRAYCTPGVDWDHLSEDEVCHIVDFPCLPLLSFPSKDDRDRSFL